MASSVTLRFEAENESLNRANAQQKKAIDDQTKGYRRLKESSQNYADTLVQSLQRTLLSWVGIQKAIQLANEAIQKNAQENRRASEQARTLAEAQAQVIRNSLGATDRELQDRFRAIDRLDRRIRTASQTQITAAFGEGLSAGGTPEQLAAAISLAAQRNISRSPQALIEPTLAFLDVTNALTEAGVELKAASSFISQTISGSRIAPQFQGAVIPAFQSIRTILPPGEQPTRDDIRLLGGFIQRLSIDALDPRGKVTASGLQNFISRLDRFAEERGFGDVGFAGQVGRLRNDRQLLEDFVGGFTGEVRTRDALIGLLRDQTDVLQAAANLDFDTAALDSNTAAIQGLTDALREQQRALQLSAAQEERRRGRAREAEARQALVGEYGVFQGLPGAEFLFDTFAFLSRFSPANQIPFETLTGVEGLPSPSEAIATGLTAMTTATLNVEDAIDNAALPTPRQRATDPEVTP